MIRVIDIDAAAAEPGMAAVITGADVSRLTRSMHVGVKAVFACWPMVDDWVRYAGDQNKSIQSKALDIYDC